MKTLFAKILVWFLVTAVITVVAVVVTAALHLPGEEPRQPPFSLLITVQMKEAQHAWETGGAEALSALLGRLRSTLRAEVILTDAAGRDLLSGADHSELIERRTRQSRLRFFRPGRMTVARPSDDGKYWFILTAPRSRWAAWFARPEYLWILGMTVLLCYGLALHLAGPVRGLQKAVARFGAGDLSARVRSTRRDELGQLARTFDQMAERIQTLLQAERRLLLDISHELRSPLARLSLAIELARSGQDREFTLDRIQKEADRLNALVGELFEVTRAEGDPATMRSERVALDQLVQGLVEECDIEANARGCTLELAAPQPVTVHGNAELLRRAVENILRNAIRYSPAGAAVEIALAGTDRGARIRVRDYGPGVPEESLPRIFDAFYRVDSDRNRESGGVGLGLAIARRAVELHRGKLHARNASPGLMVEMEIPRGTSPTGRMAVIPG